MTTRYQKRHYEDVARLLNKQPIASVGSLYQAVKRMGEDFADLFAADSPQFDRARFLSACGLDYEGEE